MIYLMHVKFPANRREDIMVKRDRLFKTGAEKAWAEVKNAYHDASSRFK